MNRMRRSVVASAVLLFASLSALGQTRRPARFANPILDDVVQMSRAELPEETILAFVRARRARLGNDVMAEDLIRLHRAGVSHRVIELIASLSGLEDESHAQEVEVGEDSRGSSAAPVDPVESDVEAVPEPYGSVYDGWGWGWEPYPYWYAYSPFFYGGIVIAGGHSHRRHHFDHDGGGHHHRGGNHFGHSDGSRTGGGHRGGGGHGSASHSGGHGHR